MDGYVCRIKFTFEAFSKNLKVQRGNFRAGASSISCDEKHCTNQVCQMVSLQSLLLCSNSSLIRQPIFAKHKSDEVQAGHKPLFLWLMASAQLCSLIHHSNFYPCPPSKQKSNRKKSHLQPHIAFQPLVLVMSFVPSCHNDRDTTLNYSFH